MKRVADWATRFYFSVLIEDFAFKRGDPVGLPGVLVLGV
jgi:hypothetical protein